MTNRWLLKKEINYISNARRERICPPEVQTVQEFIADPQNARYLEHLYSTWNELYPFFPANGLI